jgi:hypothetical protein
MPQYDVLANPAAAMRRARPLILVLQHVRLDHARTVVIAPLADADVLAPHPPLLPEFEILGRRFVLVALELTHIRRAALPGTPMANLAAEHDRILRALDHLFSVAG